MTLTPKRVPLEKGDRGSWIWIELKYLSVPVGDDRRLQRVLHPRKEETPNIRNFGTGHGKQLGQLLQDKKEDHASVGKGLDQGSRRPRSHLGGFCEAQTPEHRVREASSGAGC